MHSWSLSLTKLVSFLNRTVIFAYFILCLVNLEHSNNECKYEGRIFLESRQSPSDWIKIDVRCVINVIVKHIFVKKGLIPAGFHVTVLTTSYDKMMHQRLYAYSTVLLV